MQKVNIRSYIGIAILIAFFSCAKGATIATGESQKIQNLRAFAKLYGYVKYFHPSDEASSIDWDKFAIYGAKQVKDVKDTAELKAALDKLFLPIAPTIQIYTSDQKPEDPMKDVPEDTTGLKIVAWQHLGVRSSKGSNSYYKSIRLNRVNKLSGAMWDVGSVSQTIDATKYCGKEIKIKAFVRTSVHGPTNQGHLWLRVDAEDEKNRFFDSMYDRPIKSNEWKSYKIETDVAGDAKNISFGCILRGTGKLWLDEFRLFTRNKKRRWETIEIKNPGFEEEDENNKPEAWSLNGGYSYIIDKEEPYKGNKCLLIEDRSEIFSGKLFEEHPKIGEAVNKPLGSGLFCQVPLALYSDENRTLGKNEKYPLRKLLGELEAVHISKLTANDEDVRLAGVVITWNVFQHFYPYFDVVNVDWESELANAMRQAITNKNERDFHYTLFRFAAKLQDGHLWVGHTRLESQWAYLPFCVDWIEDQVVVIASKESPKVKIGDIIVSIDGIEAEQALLNQEEYMAGSRHWRRHAALVHFGYGDKGTKANLVVKRGDKKFQIEVARITLSSVVRNYRDSISELRRPKIDSIQDDIYYVDLTRAQKKEIEKKIPDLVEAKGVVFDFRGYPRRRHGCQEVIRHLLREKDTSDAWCRTPQIIYPDFENEVGYKNEGWGLEPKEPRIKGKVVFLTDADALSAAESYMSFVEHYKLGEIVGQPTAGVNGNSNVFVLPGGYNIWWTGMKVVKHDGSQHHFIGILPTVPVQRSIRGVIEGRDEFLEKALEIISK
jgi:hypothetical protein